MRIVFGQRNFKIREFSPQELGFISDSNIDFNIEVRQNYFHLYWIPFFGTGKMWAIRRNGELYELPIEYHQHIKARRVKVRSPWYTYTLPIIAALGFLVYISVEKVKDYQSDKQDRAYFIQSVENFDTKIEKPALNEFFVLEDPKEYTAESKIYLKVEKVYADKIVFTLIPGFFLESSGLKLEDCYTQNKSQLDTITISKKELKSAFVRDYDVSRTSNFKGINLLKSDKLYRIASIEQGWQTLLTSSVFFKNDDIVRIELRSTGSGFTILSIKNVENSVPWDIKLPQKIKDASDTNAVTFMLDSKKQDNFTFAHNDSYKAEIKILDSFNNQHTYLLSGNYNYASITKFN